MEWLSREELQDAIASYEAEDKAFPARVCRQALAALDMREALDSETAAAQKVVEDLAKQDCKHWRLDGGCAEAEAKYPPGGMWCLPCQAKALSAHAVEERQDGEAVRTSKHLKALAQAVKTMGYCLDELRKHFGAYEEGGAYGYNPKARWGAGFSALVLRGLHAKWLVETEGVPDNAHEVFESIATPAPSAQVEQMAELLHRIISHYGANGAPGWNGMLEEGRKILRQYQEVSK